MFQIGDRVKFARSFIQSVNGHELATLRGTVAQVIDPVKKAGCTIPGRLKIQWDDSEGSPEGALMKNISKA